jgi:hypothetical protein
MSEGEKTKSQHLVDFYHWKPRILGREVLQQIWYVSSHLLTLTLQKYEFRNCNIRPPTV